MALENDDYFIANAIELARNAMDEGSGGPFGAVIVLNNEIIGKGKNTVTSSKDPTAHAEISAIRSACLKLGTHDLSGATIYTSCEPCPMCLGAILWARIGRIVYAATRQDAANIAGFDDAAFYEELTKPWNRRSIQSSQLSPDLGKKVFEDWVLKPDKKMY